jgi:hypothetical protein
MENSEVLQEFRVLETGSSFITKNFQKLQEQYPNKFVAVEEGKVILSSERVEELVHNLQAMKKELGRILIEFIPKKGLIILY